MKAIRTRYIGQTDRMPARWVAEDGDGYRAFVTAASGTAADAVEALCGRMGWSGELVAGGFKNDEFWVWLEPGSPRITVTPMPLPSNIPEDQARVINDRRAADCLRRIDEKARFEESESERQAECGEDCTAHALDCDGYCDHLTDGPRHVNACEGRIGLDGGRRIGEEEGRAHA